MIFSALLRQKVKLVFESRDKLGVEVPSITATQVETKLEAVPHEGGETGSRSDFVVLSESGAVVRELCLIFDQPPVKLSDVARLCEEAESEIFDVLGHSTPFA